MPIWEEYLDSNSGFYQRKRDFSVCFIKVSVSMCFYFHFCLIRDFFDCYIHIYDLTLVLTSPLLISVEMGLWSAKLFCLTHQTKYIVSSGVPSQQSLPDNSKHQSGGKRQRSLISDIVICWNEHKLMEIFGLHYVNYFNCLLNFFF